MSSTPSPSTSANDPKILKTIKDEWQWYGLHANETMGRNVSAKREKQGQPKDKCRIRKPFILIPRVMSLLHFV
jgi:hypothetical protein